MGFAVCVCVCVCVTLVLTASYDAAAQSKKKGKEPELAISKRGKLIFEDEFAGKDILWEFDASKCKWEIAKKALITRSLSIGSSSEVAIGRSFPPLPGIIVELRMLVPPDCEGVIGSPRGAGSAYGYVQGSTAKSTGRMKLRRSPLEGEKAGLDLAIEYFPYRKGQWADVLFEIAGQQYALTVAGKTITCDCAPADLSQITRLLIRHEGKQSPDVLAIDDVKVWEALPKDEDTEKDKKTKK